MIRAIIFDFDGLIIETEEPTYLSWVEVYKYFGFPLPLATWSAVIGTTHGDFNPQLELERLLNHPVDWETVEPIRQASENALIEAQPILPGAEAYLRNARHLGLKIGLASNSPTRWVIGHLTRIGLVDCFDCIRTSDDVHSFKPDPSVYLSALNGLAVSADDAFALEDSPLGIRAAKSAGLFCVAVPNKLTRRLDLSGADFQLGSLTGLPLEQLLHKVSEIKTRRAAL